MADLSIEIRDVIARTANAITDLGDPKNAIEAAVGAVGAAAIFLALMPDRYRGDTIAKLQDALPLMVKQRRKEILSGDFDQHMERRQ